MEELRKLTTYWAAQGEPLPLVIADFFSLTSEPMTNIMHQVGLMLSSRKNLCLHPEVKGERDGKVRARYFYIYFTFQVSQIITHKILPILDW